MFHALPKPQDTKRQNKNSYVSNKVSHSLYFHEINVVFNKTSIVVLFHAPFIFRNHKTCLVYFLLGKYDSIIIQV